MPGVQTSEDLQTSGSVGQRLGILPLGALIRSKSRPRAAKAPLSRSRQPFDPCQRETLARRAARGLDLFHSRAARTPPPTRPGTMRRWPVTLLAAGAARATPGARSSSPPRELLVADAVEALYELPPLPVQTDARELTTYEEAWTRRLPYLENIPTRYFAGLASILEREHAPGEEPRRDAAAAERRRRLQGEKMTGDLEAPGIILLIVFVPMLFIILWYAQGCCRPKQVVPT